MRFLTSEIDSGLEIRRILLLTHLRSAKGRTLEQLVKECGKVEGWRIAGKATDELVLSVLQSLIDDRYVGVARRFFLTEKGREYLEDPLKWHLDAPTMEDMDERMAFWNAIYTNIYETFERVVSRIRSGNIRAQ